MGIRDAEEQCILFFKALHPGLIFAKLLNKWIVKIGREGGLFLQYHVREDLSRPRIGLSKMLQKGYSSLSGRTLA